MTCAPEDLTHRFDFLLEEGDNLSYDLYSSERGGMGSRAYGDVEGFLGVQMYSIVQEIPEPTSVKEGNRSKAVWKCTVKREPKMYLHSWK